jgi:GDP-4-dehydro-6-deoxy-D-mannose reductase
LRVLITGASGLTGGWLARACADAGEEVFGLSRSGLVAAGRGVAVDLRDGPACRDAFRSIQPDVVYHLAALSSVGRSWEEPAQTVNDNTSSSVSVLEAVRLDAPAARVLWVSSCEVYGAPERLPISEDAPLKPANPYAVSKVAGDLLAGLYADAHGLNLVRARPFSHAGPGQRAIFIVSSLARQAAEARLAGKRSIEIVTGNPDTRRDFTDVRDVVRAYRLLAAGEQTGIFNVSSGHSISAAEQVQLLTELLAPIEVHHIIDPARVRAHEVMELRGDHSRLTAATGWEPQIPFRQTMQDSIEWWQAELTVGATAEGLPSRP